MKKTISLILSLCMLTIPQFTTVTATENEATSNEVILSVSDAEWTLTEDLATYNVSGADYGDENLKITAVGIKKSDGTTDMTTALSSEQLNENIYVTYSKNIPQGAYKVMYLYPDYVANPTYSKGRNVTILDCDLTITDANGTHTVKSTKPDIAYGGWVEVGVYEFSGNSSDSIKVSVNQDNKVVAGQWKKSFLSSEIKLVPQTTDYSQLLAAVNAATTVAEIKNATETYGGDLLDVNALNYMVDTYSEILTKKTEGGFKSAYQYKNVFEAAVSDKLDTIVINSSSFVWQNTQNNVDSLGYRINWEPVQLESGEGRAVVTFKVNDTLNIKALKLKLNPSAEIMNNAVIKKYSSDIIEVPNSNEEHNKFMNSAVFEDLATSIKVTASQVCIKDDAIIKAIRKNGYISFYLVGDDITYQGTNAINKYLLGATLTVEYDKTYNPNMSMASADVNNEAINTSKVFDLNGFSKIDSVTVNETELADEKYSFNGSRLLIEASVFKDAGVYTVEVKEGNESRSAVLNLVAEKFIYAQDSEKATWSATPVSNLDNSMTRPDTTHNLQGVATATDTSVTYTKIPTGQYELYMYYPKWLSTVSCSMGRTSGIYDSSADITDSNGSYSIKSTKPSINYEGYTKIGTYEFSGKSNENIKFFVNKDYADIASYIGTRYFAQYAVKFVPVSNEEFVKYYYDNGVSFIENVNNSADKNEFVERIKTITSYTKDFIDTDALYDMSGVYDELYSSLRQAKFKTEYEFKSAFDKAVSSYVEIREISSSLLLSTYTDDGETLNVVYRKNSTPSMGVLGKSYASFTFDEVANLEPKAIIDAQLKINTNTYADDYYLTQYSVYAPTIVNSDSVLDGILDGNSDANRESNVFFECFNPTNEKVLMPFFTQIDTAELKEAAEKNLPLSYYVQLKNKITDYSNSNTFTGATLRISYDKTYQKSVVEAANEIATQITLDDAKELMGKYLDIFGITSDKKDSYALALWNESIATDSDVEKCISALNKPLGINKSVKILTEKEYIGGVTVKNFGQSETPVRIIAAAYDNTGAMIGMDFADRVDNLQAGDAYVYAFKLNIADFNLIDSVKVFAWGDMINLTPLAETVEYE